MGTRYPIYVISLGRPLVKTSSVLHGMNVPHTICVEPQEVEIYAKNFENLTILPENFSKQGNGSIPVRNWVMEDSITKGYKRHWILDDNIEGFNRLNKNSKYVVKCDSTFKAAEDFTDRYKNIALSGMNYYSFAKATDPVPPFNINTRIYSCILVNNEIPFRWRGRYNEDTDLSLRCLKDGWNTILFNAFLCGKITTLRQKGGNTDSIYNTGDERKAFAESLRDQHPDIVKVVRRYDRWHHQVDYREFKKRTLEYIDGYDPTEEPPVNDYGMKLYRPTEEKS